MRRITLDDVVVRTAAFARERVGLAPPRPVPDGGAPGRHGERRDGGPARSDGADGDIPR
jgi:hypothetical protein